MRVTRFYILILIPVLFSIGNRSFGQNPFIYNDKGEKIYFTLREDLVSIKFNSAISLGNRSAALEHLNIKGKIFIDTKSKDLPIVFELSELINRDASLSLLSMSDDIESINQVLQYRDGTLQSLSDQIFIKLKNSKDFNLLRQKIDPHIIKTLEETAFCKDLYVLTFIGKLPKTTLSIANDLYESGLFEYVEPNFIRFIKPYVDDPFFSEQWALNNTGQFNGTPDADIDAFEAWSMTQGTETIRIAILDEGVDLTHPDLAGNLLQGFDETGLGSQGAPQGNDAHGTNCAGIMGAIENTIGVIGVAPHCRIIPIRIAYQVWDPYRGWIWQTNDNWISNGFYHAWHDSGAHIISNSWGGGSESTTITNAINNAMTEGRNNLGSVVVFAAGNNNDSINYPAKLPNVISVGATSMCDQRKRSSSDPNLVNPGVTPDPDDVSCDGETWWGSNFGSQLDIVAPGVHVYSTDIQGAAGYNHEAGANGNYFDHFNGTSSACPHVAAVAALILSINPNFTRAHVESILETTTDKLGNYNFANYSNKPNGTWNIEVGYGRLNANRAVFEAYTHIISISGPDLLCSLGDSYTLGILPSVFDIEWTSSQNISVPDPSSNPSFLYGQDWGGSGWVGATITLESCDCEYVVDNIPVWSGRPWGQTTDPSGYPPVYMGIYSPLDVALTSAPGASLWDANWSSSGSLETEINHGQSGRFNSIAPGTGYFYVTTYNDCGDGPMYQGEVWVDDSQQTKIAPDNELSMSISPNPANDYFDIELIDKGSNELINSFVLEIIDPYSRIIKKEKLSGPNNRVNIQDLSVGHYLIVARVGKIVLQQTLIIQR